MPKSLYSDIFQFVQEKETEFTRDHSVYSNWSWNWKDHVEQSFFYKYGRLIGGNSDDKPVKNIVRPILNLAYRAEDIDVKDISIYVDDADKYHLSFLVKKYHDEVFVKENDLDTFFDEAKEEKIDYGGALVQKMKGARPKKIDVQNICFADKSDIMSAPFGIQMSMSASELIAMKDQGWGSEANGATISIDELITLHQEYQAESYNKTQDVYKKDQDNNIKIYQVWGYLPAEYVGGEEGKYTLQLHYICYLKKPDETKMGVSLFSKEDREKKRFKFVNRDKVHNRAFGYGGVEELFEPQMWTNSTMKWKTDVIRSASKMIMQSADPGVVARHPTGLKDLENFEVVEFDADKGGITQIDTTPRNINLFTNLIQEWEVHGRTTGSAQDPLLGEPSPSGTPFRSQERQVIEGKGLHEYRREKYARFIEEIYRDWIIPYIASEITKGVTFLSTLTADELEFVANNVATRTVNQTIIDNILNGELPNPEELAVLKETTKADFLRKGNKRFLKILENELKNAKLKVHVDVAGSSKDMGLFVDKLNNVFRQIFANPAILQDPRAQKLLNRILESSGVPLIDFSSFETPQALQQVQQQPNMQQNMQQVVPEMALQ